MVKAKNPGAGQGRGGGRPPGKSTKPARQVEEVRLRLSPHVAELLRAMAEDQGAPAWEVVERALLSMGAKGGGVLDTPSDGAISNPTKGSISNATLAPPFPPEAQEIAQECAAFLDAAQDRSGAARALRRAWNQALALARHDLGQVFPLKGEKPPAEGVALTVAPELILEDQKPSPAPVRVISRKH